MRNMRVSQLKLCKNTNDVSFFKTFKDDDCPFELNGIKTFSKIVSFL